MGVLVWDDAAVLDAMRRVDYLHQSYGQVATVLGFSRSSVAGLVKRVRDAGGDLGLPDSEVLAMMRAFHAGRPAAWVAGQFKVTRMQVLAFVHRAHAGSDAGVP